MENILLEIVKSIIGKFTIKMSNWKLKSGDWEMARWNIVRHSMVRI